MNSIRTTIIDGHVHVQVSDHLPDGTEVEVQISAIASDTRLGDGQWDSSAKGIETWINQYEQLEPLELTEAERAEIATALQEQKEWETERFSERAEKQRKRWE